MKICIDDGSTNIKLAWTENGERRNAISPNSFKSEWSAPFGGTQPANYMLDGVRYGFDPVSDRFVQTTDTQYQYSDVNAVSYTHLDVYKRQMLSRAALSSLNKLTTFLSSDMKTS